MDNGLLYKFWVKEIDSTQDFSYKLGTIIKHGLEGDFVIYTFESFPLEWIDLKIEPIRHLIRLDIHGVNGQYTMMENYPPGLDLEWEALPDPLLQLKQRRALVQRSNWLWNKNHDLKYYLLIGKTYTKKKYWPVSLGTIFFPFKFTTQHTTLCHYYQNKH